jgi:alpha-N-arabinofuranosidase
VQGKLRNETRAALCFDEWNVWYKNRQMDGEGKAAPHLIEEVYNLEDALVVAGYLNSFIRHADVVKIANIAQIVNVIAPILTRGDEMLLQSSFYAFEMMARRRDGVSLRVAVEGPEFVSEAHGRAKVIDASAILGEGQLHVFAVNRGVDESSEVRVALADASITALSSGELLTGPDAKAANSFEEPDVVRSQPFDAVDVADGDAAFTMPPLSLVALTFDLA